MWKPDAETTQQGLLDPAAFRPFYERALPVVYGYFYRRCGGRSEVASDLTQETFLSAVHALRGGVLVNAPLPWIVSIARRRLVDHYRRQERGTRLWAILRSTAEVSSADETVSEGEARLVEALATLPSHYRLALVLRHVDDLPVAEVAGHLDKSVRATESLLVRARVALGDAFERTTDG
jgi:RNA polymerase sigma-70 factor, ECF subfamily